MSNLGKFHAEFWNEKRDSHWEAYRLPDSEYQVAKALVCNNICCNSSKENFCD